MENKDKNIQIKATVMKDFQGMTATAVFVIPKVTVRFIVILSLQGREKNSFPGNLSAKIQPQHTVYKSTKAYTHNNY